MAVHLAEATNPAMLLGVVAPKLDLYTLTGTISDDSYRDLLGILINHTAKDFNNLGVSAYTPLARSIDSMDISCQMSRV